MLWLKYLNIHVSLCPLLFQGPSQTYTVVTKVKEDCNVWRGKLRAYDRIICINNIDVSRDDGSHALKLLTGSCGPYVKLLVCQPDRFRVVGSGRVLEGLETGYGFGTLHVPLGSTDTKGTAAAVQSDSAELKLSDNLNKDIENKTDQLNKKVKEREDLTLSDNKDHKLDCVDAAGFSADFLEKNKLNDLSKVGPNTPTEAYETNQFSVVPNITSVNSQSSQNTCSTNPSSDFDSFPSWNRNKFNSDSSNEGKSNIELVDRIIRDSNNLHDSARQNSEFSAELKLNRNTSGGNLSSGLKSQNDVSLSMKSNCSLLSRHSGQSVDSMGKSKGDKIVRKFYKGNSQDSNEGAEELEPLRLGDGGQHFRKGKADSRYTHMNDDDRTLSIPLTKEVALSVQDIVFDESSQTVPFGK